MYSRYFTEEEFKRATPACSLSDMNPGLIERLDYARALCGFPFVINSAYRTKEYEISMGRSGDSSHCKGLAVDIQCLTSRQRLFLVHNLLRAGFKRIGIAENFIHVDLDTGKVSGIWLYDR